MFGGNYVLGALIHWIFKFSRNIEELELSDLGSSLLAISEELYTKDQSEKLEKLLGFLEIAGIPYPSTQIKDTVEKNIEWFDYHGKDLEAFLTKHYNDDCEDKWPSSATVPYGMSLLAILVITGLGKLLFL